MRKKEEEERPRATEGEGKTGTNTGVAPSLPLLLLLLFLLLLYISISVPDRIFCLVQCHGWGDLPIVRKTRSREKKASESTAKRHREKEVLSKSLFMCYHFPPQPTAQPPQILSRQTGGEGGGGEQD